MEISATLMNLLLILINLPVQNFYAHPVQNKHAHNEQASPYATPQQTEIAQTFTQTETCPRPQQVWYDHLKIITMNVRGLFKSKEDVHDLITHHDPDILSHRNQNYRRDHNAALRRPQWLDHLLRDYAWWHSSHHNSGTILCVKENIATTTQASQVQCQDNIDGRLVAAKLNTTNKPILLISTYWPSGNSHAALETRKRMEGTLKGLINSCLCLPILLGDMNATLFSQDRTRGMSYEQDKLFRTFIVRNIWPAAASG
eukprot:1149104-Pelagomonas_calceolata.AAC.4